MSAKLRPASLAEGNLASDPFLHLLLAAFEHRFGGSLVVWRGDQASAAKVDQQRLLLEEGVVVAADLGSDDRNLLSALIPLSVRRAGHYRFLPRVNVVGDDRRILRGHVDPYMLAASALRGPVREDAIEAVVQSSGERILQLRPGCRSERLGLTRDEWNFLQDLRRRPASAGTLLARHRAPGHFVKRMIYLLRLTGMVAALPAGRKAESRAVSVPGPPPPSPALGVGRPTAPPRAAYDAVELEEGDGRSGVVIRAPEVSPSPIPAPALRPDMPFAEPVHLSSQATADDTRPIRLRIASQPPPGMSPGLAYRYRQILQHHQRLRTRNLFELLGVGPEDGDEAIEDAYTVLIAQWRADALPPQLYLLTPVVEEITTGLTEAYGTLTDPGCRHEYIERLRNGDGRLLSLARADAEEENDPAPGRSRHRAG